MIFISAGHYASRPGAGFDDFYEFDEASRWAEHLVDHLGDAATLVPYGVLKEKVAFINNRNGTKSIAMEIHFNAAVDAMGNNIGKGCETLYYPGSEKGKRLAELANNALAQIFKPNRGIKEGWYRMDKRRGPDFFLAKTKCPAIIIEPDFIHRKELIQDGMESCCNELAAALIAAEGELT